MDGAHSHSLTDPVKSGSARWTQSILIGDPMTVRERLLKPHGAETEPFGEAIIEANRHVDGRAYSAAHCPQQEVE